MSNFHKATLRSQIKVSQWNPEKSTAATTTPTTTPTHHYNATTTIIISVKVIVCNQLTNQSINQSISQSINQSIHRSINQSNQSCRVSSPWPVGAQPNFSMRLIAAAPCLLWLSKLPRYLAERKCGKTRMHYLMDWCCLTTARRITKPEFKTKRTRERLEY